MRYLAPLKCYCSLNASSYFSLYFVGGQTMAPFLGIWNFTHADDCIWTCLAFRVHYRLPAKVGKQRGAVIFPVQLLHMLFRFASIIRPLHRLPFAATLLFWGDPMMLLFQAAQRLCSPHPLLTKSPSLKHFTSSVVFRMLVIPCLKAGDHFLRNWCFLPGVRRFELG